MSILFVCREMFLISSIANLAMETNFVKRSTQGKNGGGGGGGGGEG